MKQYLKFLILFIGTSLSAQKTVAVLDFEGIGNLLKDKKLEDISMSSKFHLYQLLGDKSFLEHAYEDIQKTVNKLEGEKKESYLNYTYVKLIVEEHNKVMD